MKQVRLQVHHRVHLPFSALGRAVWDETAWAELGPLLADDFQCSRSSRMG